MCSFRVAGTSVSAVYNAASEASSPPLPYHSEDDVRFFGPDLPEMCRERLAVDEEGFYHCHYRFRPFPSKHVSIRTTDDETYQVIDVSGGKYKVLEEIEWKRAIFELYEGAIFMHQGQSFLVKELNHDRRFARLERTNVEWTTRQRDFTYVCALLLDRSLLMAFVIRDVDAIETLRIREIADAPLPAYYGRVKSEQLHSTAFWIIC